MKYTEFQGNQYRRLGLIATSPNLKAKLWQQFRLWTAFLFPF